MEARLDPSRFVRIRSSNIVQIARIREVRPLSNGMFELRLQDGTRVTSARRFRDRIEKIVSGRG